MGRYVLCIELLGQRTRCKNRHTHCCIVVQHSIGICSTFAQGQTLCIVGNISFSFFNCLLVFLNQRDLLFANCPISLETEVTELLSYFLFTFLSHSPTPTHRRSTCPCVSFSHIHYIIIQEDLEIQKATYFFNGTPLHFGEVVSLSSQGRFYQDMLKE